MPIHLKVIPHAPYVEHLEGAFDAGEDTVRLFASLSLARLHPDVKSWAAAAEALAMPGPMGVRCGRACSATMRVTAAEWEARIWRAIEAFRRRDYRATESQDRTPITGGWMVRGMGQPVPARNARHQPALRTHLAMGARRPRHLDLSPVWCGKKPTATDRALYRQFEASLDEQQQSELATPPFTSRH